ncbi:hypothetical protein LCGC14_1594410 [marine sediment metagenome]|uniref:Uncharacterized protein n=1 Tax=marine sediment metagenome TaxID=412755 RepID=A0A0F9LDG5_9ZZZZ
MLLQEVYQLPEKQWTPDANPVAATLTVVGQYSTDQYGFKQPVQLKDDQGVSSEVVVQSKYEKGLMNPSMVGNRVRWRLKWYQGSQKQVIVGYCLDKIPSSPGLALQPASALPQTPNTSNTPQPRDYDAENKGKVRTQFVKAAIIAKQIVIGPDHIGDLNYWTEYAMTGNAPLPPERQHPGDLLTSPTLNEEVPWGQP